MRPDNQRLLTRTLNIQLVDIIIAGQMSAEYSVVPLNASTPCWTICHLIYSLSVGLPCASLMWMSSPVSRPTRFVA